MEHSVPSTGPTAELAPISDEQRAVRLRRLAERLRSHEGLDRETLAQIEQLSGEEQ